MLRWYGEAYGLQWMALRYVNASGADPDAEIGEIHDPETHLVPLVIEAAMGKRPHIGVFGTDYPTPDGTAVRDYSHVMDLARAHVLALQYLETDGASGAVNLGTGQGHSIDEVIAAVEAVSGKTVPVERNGRRAGDPAMLVANPSRAEAVLGWTPQYRDLDAIMETAWRWHNRPVKATEGE
jgi:UDP-glucose 4-epimerase